ncbi:heparinase II/III domain-containing protein [Microvirga lenta]|uniref:heparinase II/III domain-containing protein n=1 Tax=Microvirga lenta TaxID=2881337 RepID=UPI001CFF60A5|nr:heparinase II/III family protein [Microvirga lenta]MCB5177740.1 heparinase II/III family protein [Microvirga lenta]
MSDARHILPSSIQHAGDSLPGPADGQHIIATKNRWSRVALTFTDVASDAWCEFSFDVTCPPEETASQAHDFAAVGVAFLMADQSSIDFAYIPGLTRAQIDPFSTFVSGPHHHDKRISPTQTYRVHCNFLVPAPTKHLLITVRGWRNSHPFHVTNLSLRQHGGVAPRTSPTQALPPAPSRVGQAALSGSTRTWTVLTSSPEWFRYSLVPGRPLFVRGQIIAESSGKDGALARVVFRDQLGQELPPPYPETLTAPAVGAFVNIPAHIQARRFTLELIPPENAASVEIGFQTWHDAASVRLVMPLEVSLEVGLLLENISGDETPHEESFLKQLMEKLDPAPISGERQSSQEIAHRLIGRGSLASPFKIHSRLRALQQGNDLRIREGGLQFSGYSPWPLPERYDWREDPFRSPGWRREYQSLAWLLSIAERPDAGGLDRAIDLAISWSRSNTWGQPTDDLSVHPLPLATRTEVFIELLALGAAAESADIDALSELLGEAIRHGFVLAEIIGQNVFSHSIYQAHAASALLSLGKALPQVPTARYWASLALSHLQQSFKELVGPDGTFFESAPHYQLELVSLGAILGAALKDDPEAHTFCEELETRLRNAVLNLIEVTDPDGHLPAFGDTPHLYRHASWIRRLIAQYGQDWLTDSSIKAELSYPRGSRILPSQGKGMAVARHYGHERDWRYLCSSYGEQRNSHGHHDATSFVFSDAGSRWIVDAAGSSQNEGGPVRQYLTSSRGHNVAIPDGREQTAGSSWIETQFSLRGVNVLELRSTVHGPDYNHRRVYVSTADLAAVAVIDDFAGMRDAHSFEGLLHFDPNVTAAIAPAQTVIAFCDRRRLHIIPYTVTGRLSGLEVLQGISDQQAALQGFVSRPSGGLQPASVLRYKFSGRSRVSGGVILATTGAGLKTIKRMLSEPELAEYLTRQPADQDAG